jgi:MoaA/NifB/PqqE/SkfB family radical SAM enzyme
VSLPTTCRGAGVGITSGNSRCSTAVVLGRGVGAKTWKHFDPDQRHGDRRRLLCVNVADTWYCTIHAPAFGGPCAVQYAEYMLKKCNTDFERFVCGGDYNNPADQIPHISGKVHASPPAKATHISGGKIDYVVSKNIVYQCAEVGSVGQSDHTWAIFEA